MRSFSFFVASGSIALLVAACGGSSSSSDTGGGGGGGDDASGGGKDGGGGSLDATVGGGDASTMHVLSDGATCGTASSPCPTGISCTAAAQCASGVCATTCQAPSPSDGVQNGGETDVDCGGQSTSADGGVTDGAQACANGKSCNGAADCSSGACQMNKCVPATCMDGTKNEGETDVDCGGPSCGPCGTGLACTSGSDCVSVDCKMNICQAATCSDQIKNGNETDKDCGGGTCNACDNGKACAQASDCTSVVCTGNVCQVPTDMDNQQNGTETGVDCGGGPPTNAPRCAPGVGCLVASDCQSDVCTAKVCQTPTDTDGVQNGGETGIDCGGSMTAGSDGAPGCGPNKACVVSTDCLSLICTSNNKCTASSPTDGVQNGDETAIDCGGAATPGSDDAPGCKDSQACKVDTDCGSGTCASTLKICVAGQSCKTSNGTDAAGIDTCGTGNVGDINAKHESCCKSLPMPTSKTVRMDKYEITAGRMRQFITAVGPDVQAWVTGQIAANTVAGQTLAAQIPASVRQFLPTTATESAAMNVIIQLGSGVGVMDSSQPSNEQGCYNGTGAYGDATYWQPADVLKSYSASPVIPARPYTQAQYDAKSMNCAPNWMMAAFCAWDGGALPTYAQQAEVWGTATYPWGATFPYYKSGAAYTTTVNYLNDNGEFFYAYPAYPADANNDDEASYIGEPGRFPLDITTAASANGDHWFDIGANQMEFSQWDASLGTGNFCDYANVDTGKADPTDCTYVDSSGASHVGQLRGTGVPVSSWMGGSWEGHQKFSYDPSAEPFFYLRSYTFPLDVQYGKTSARCVRPLD